MMMSGSAQPVPSIQDTTVIIGELLELLDQGFSFLKIRSRDHHQSKNTYYGQLEAKDNQSYAIWAYSYKDTDQLKTGVTYYRTI